MLFNLIMCVLWLLVGAALLITGYTTGRWYLTVNLGGGSFSGGWLALILALYNLARWWSVRSYRRQRQTEQQAFAQRLKRHRAETRGPEQPPDPNFDFKEPPTGPDEGRQPG
jgi:hypothetical protein